MKFNLGSIMKMKEEMERMQAQLAEKTVSGNAGGGMVTAVVNGRQQLLSIEIAPEVWEDLRREGDVTMLQDLITAAVNDALTRAQEMLKEEMSNFAGGFNLSSLTGLFG
ncbi:MAG: YbaB/EbfC family nucleoid-associated protein [Deltaproteobacteria bacterium]|nr:MAG: YbaB/EbfC family nucleoid-associated protein [Deltaproteobacteria bacterium]